MKLYNSGVYLVNGRDIVEEAQMTEPVSREDAARNTIAYSILEAHNISGNMQKLQIKFDKLTSHDITFVGIIQTARASGLEKFPVPYVLTNCHNSLCAVGGTINEDDHMFGLTCAKKYGGVYVPPHQAVIHQYAREMLAGGGKMIAKLDNLDNMVFAVEKRFPQVVQDYREKLEIKVRELLEDSQIDDNRIAAEVVLFSDKICNDEETVRLHSHIQGMKDILQEKEGVGRKMDFMAQEMNREANTILSKSNDLQISNIAIDLKTDIEKIREQIQNIE